MPDGITHQRLRGCVSQQRSNPLLIGTVSEALNGS